MQFDKNSERLSFELPRYIDSHDMSTCDKAEVHFVNSNGTETNTGTYTATDLAVVEAEVVDGETIGEDTVVCS